jgi:hypothetical protein
MQKNDLDTNNKFLTISPATRASFSKAPDDTEAMQKYGLLYTSPNQYLSTGSSIYNGVVKIVSASMTTNFLYTG